jgi:hypothetical protein
MPSRENVNNVDIKKKYNSWGHTRSCKTRWRLPLVRWQRRFTDSWQTEYSGELKAQEIALAYAEQEREWPLQTTYSSGAGVTLPQKKKKDWRLRNEEALLLPYKIYSFINVHYITLYCLLWVIFIRCLTTFYLYLKKSSLTQLIYIYLRHLH